MLVGLSSSFASSESGIVVASLVIVFLLIIGALMDGIGVAVASSKVSDVKGMQVRNRAAQELAVKLVTNAERVNNICNDVIGDVCSVLNGAFGAEIVIELMHIIPDQYLVLVSVTISSLLAALTVGSKAIIKSIAINRCNEFVLYSAHLFIKIKNLFKRKKSK